MDRATLTKKKKKRFESRIRVVKMTIRFNQGLKIRTRGSTRSAPSPCQLGGRHLIPETLLRAKRTKYPSCISRLIQVPSDSSKSPGDSPESSLPIWIRPQLDSGVAKSDRDLLIFQSIGSTHQGLML